jgi:hypothetical protein
MIFWGKSRQSLWICVPRQSRGTRIRYIRRAEEIEAEPLDMRSQAEPGNEIKSESVAELLLC